MPKGTRLFTYSDIISPIGVTVLTLGLSIWGVLVSPTLPALIISAALGVFGIFFLFYFYSLRRRILAYDYETRHGIKVKLGDDNAPTQRHVEDWTEDVIAFWTQTKLRRSGIVVSLPRQAVEQALHGTLVVFLDKEKISTVGKLVRGICTGDRIYVGYRKNTANYTYTIFRHELGHNVLGFNGWPWSNELHHTLFQLIKY